jgi:hypothetical protein
VRHRLRFYDLVDYKGSDPALSGRFYVHDHSRALVA